jgi:hypothetical protein
MKAAGELANCPSLVGFSTTEVEVGVHFDSARAMTEVYVGDYFGNRIVRHDISKTLVHTVVPLPISYGGVWVAADLDRDGNMELVVQRGDQGLGGSGWLDILSAPDWRLRGHFMFPGMKTVMHASTIDLDGDPVREILLTPSDFGGGGYVMLIDYDEVADSFYIRSQAPGPPEMTAGPAIADFDGDGRLEFWIGSIQGYSLYEWQDTALVSIFMPCDTCTPGNHSTACVCHPRRDGVTYALLGNNDGHGDYHYDLMAPIGDNQFTVVQSFFEPRLGWGYTPCGAADIDCDGLDELVMYFGPYMKTWEWDEDSCQYVQRCVWSETQYGAKLYWHPVDIDQNGTPELGGASDASFHDFTGPWPIACDTAHLCPLVSPCLCPCHGDPNCDSVRVDVLDVVRSIGVAFRSEPADSDPLCRWERTDVNCTGTTDVIDVVRVINVAFRGANSQEELCGPCVAAP